MAPLRNARRIRQKRKRILRAGFHPYATCARREPEHEQCVRPMSCDERRQFAVHGGVTRRENMGEDPHICEGRPPPARKPFRKRSGRVEWRAWERPKASNENCE